MILHLDMDAFFASVEQLDDPALRGQPVIIGGAERGVVATASYEARVFGIHSAMPIAQARKLCPHGIFLRGRGARYSELSRKVIEALHEFSPVVQKASIDEAYLDAHGLENLFGAPEALAKAVKKRVWEVTGGLTCSIGIAPVKFLAKICSDQNKPDGIFVLGPEEVDKFLLKLSLEKLPGVGQAMSASLRSFGINTVAALRGLSRDFMAERYGKWGLQLHDRAHGIDPRIVHANQPAKSESAECTFTKDIFDRKVLKRVILAHSERVGERLRKHGLAGRSITLKVKFANFRQITRTRTIAIRTCATRTIYEVAVDLLREVELPQPVRLIGVGVSGFAERPQQLALPGIESRLCFGRGSSAEPACHSNNENVEERRLNLDRTLDAIRARFGKDIIKNGASTLPAREEAEHHFDKKFQTKR